MSISKLLYLFIRTASCVPFPHSGERGDDYQTSRINTLVANPHGIFGMLSLRDVYEYKKFWALGSGDDYAIGAMFAVYDSALSAKEIAETGVRAGIEFADGSAGPIVSHVIPLEGDQ